MRRGDDEQAGGLQQSWLFPVGEIRAVTNRTDGANGAPNKRTRTRSMPANGQQLNRDILEQLSALHQRLEALETLLTTLTQNGATQHPAKECYSTIEVAQILGRRPYTVREWCRLKRVNAEKTWSGRGQDDEWRIPHAELLRIQNEGLLPLEKLGRTRATQSKPR